MVLSNSGVLVLYSGFAPRNPLSLRLAYPFHPEKTAPSPTNRANPALNLAPFGRWTLRDKAAQRRLALR